MKTILAELRIFASGIFSFRSILLHLALLAAFGVWIPRMKGLDFLDIQVLAAYACLGLLFAGPATAQLFTRDLAASFAQAKARIFVGVLYGEIVVMTLLGAGIATVYLSQRGGYVPEPDWPTLAKAAMFGFGAAVMLASMAALVTVRFSKKIAVMCLRLTFFGLLILFFYKGQRLPDVGLIGTAICLVLASLFIEGLRRVCR